ncbi:PIG-L deacetylase family protein [Ramlibacter tataouinensis]|uniref:PIG-L deacetylase family protein n=1 Tax=Ramlibacter tataouinensis TaxID=94132 RepID=UPI001D1017CE|nr:PIG-L deacetylase family protein [Ramlibacter tataouinensis]
MNLLPRDPAVPPSLLFLGAHCDDIEIGCGGTILRLLGDLPQAQVTWVVFSSSSQREREARASASLFLEQAHGPKDVLVHQFRDGFFPHEGARIKDAFEALKKTVNPDLIFTHYRDDRHQDHRTISDLTWNTWRRHLILEYEIPKYDGDLGAPNCFVPLDRAACERKARLICEQFQSERNKGWMTEDTFLALARLRGIECAAPGGFAEAFYCRKFTLSAA